MNKLNATTLTDSEPDYFVFADFGDGHCQLYRSGLTGPQAVSAMTRLEAMLDSGMYGRAVADFGRTSDPDDLPIAHRMGLV